MSNSYSTPNLSDPIAVDAAAVIETIHGLQVDLSILAAWLARNPEPIMQGGAVVALAMMRECLMCHAPPVQRH